MATFSEFCDNYNITHIRKRSIIIRIWQVEKMEWILSREMRECANVKISGKENPILDIHLLGLDEVRASIAFADDSWHYGFGTGHKFAMLNKEIKIKEHSEMYAVEKITKEMREYALSYLKRKPYKILKPSVLAGIRL